MANQWVNEHKNEYCFLDNLIKEFIRRDEEYQEDRKRNIEKNKDYKAEYEKLKEEEEEFKSWNEKLREEMKVIRDEKSELGKQNMFLEAELKEAQRLKESLNGSFNQVRYCLNEQIDKHKKEKKELKKEIKDLKKTIYDTVFDRYEVMRLLAKQEWPNSDIRIDITSTDCGVLASIDCNE